MPSHTYNIAIAGAGVMGLSAAYALSVRGHTVTIFDPAGFPADNASFMAGGMLAPWSEIEHMPEEFIAAGLESIALWKEIVPGVAQNSSLFIAHEEDRYILERFITHLPANIGKKLNRADMLALEPELQKFNGGLYLPGEAHLNPQETMMHLIELLRARDVSLTQKEYADGNFDYVIDCRGFGAKDPNLRGIKGETVIVRNPEFSLSRPVRLMHPRYPLYIVPRENNIFMIGATVIESAGSENVSVRSALELLSALYSLHPSFGEAEIIKIQAGIRPAYADNLPRIKAEGNRISCNGLFRHGFLLAPVMAQCVADHIAGKTNSFMSLFGENDDRDGQRDQKNLRSAA